MSITVAVPRAHFQEFRAHLSGPVEQVGFFLADFDDTREQFAVRDWRPLASDAFDFQSEDHVVLRDEMRPALIKWAWDANACLIEAHSHTGKGSARFSPSDLWGLEEWVPHVRWRLNRRPYAAIVVAGASFDGFAWVDDTAHPEQLEQIHVEEEVHQATGLSLPWVHGA